MTTRQIQNYVAFNPSSSNADEWWTADTLNELVHTLRYVAIISGTLKRRNPDGMWGFADLEIYDIRVHPALRNELE